MKGKNNPPGDSWAVKYNSHEQTHLEFTGGDCEGAPATSFLPGRGTAALRTSLEDPDTASPAPPWSEAAKLPSQLGREGGGEETTSKEDRKPHCPFVEEISWRADHLIRYY